jgi:hypothetical protein
MKVNTYIGFGTLMMMCTQYGICGQVTFKNARVMVFLNLSGHAIIFSWVHKNLDFLDERLPLPEYPPPPKSSWGGGNLTYALLLLDIKDYLQKSLELVALDVVELQQNL